MLVTAEIDGEKLDDQAIFHESLLILIGGDETTRHVISGGMLALLEHPDQWAALIADPSQKSVVGRSAIRGVLMRQPFQRGGVTFDGQHQNALATFNNRRSYVGSLNLSNFGNANVDLRPGTIGNGNNDNSLSSSSLVGNVRPIDPVDPRMVTRRIGGLDAHRLDVDVPRLRTVELAEPHTLPRAQRKLAADKNLAD